MALTDLRFGVYLDGGSLLVAAVYVSDLELLIANWMSLGRTVRVVQLLKNREWVNVPVGVILDQLANESVKGDEA